MTGREWGHIFCKTNYCYPSIVNVVKSIFCVSASSVGCLFGPTQAVRDTFDSSDELSLVVPGVVGLNILVVESDTFLRGFLVVDDHHVLNILSWMNTDILITSPFECCNVLCIL